MKKDYALYKGDKFIGVGSRAELANLIGVKPSTITFYMSPTYQARNQGSDHYEVFIVEEDDDE